MVSFSSIDLFAGAGGLSLGLECAGIRAVAALDFDADCCATFRARFPGTVVLHADADALDFGRFAGVDVVVGGPPCQPFSNGGKLLAEKDSRNMIPTFIRAVQQIKPRAFLMENVAGLLAERNRTYVLGLLASLRSDYQVCHPTLLNAADYGVAQNRKRAFIIGTRRGVQPFRFPAPTHGPLTQKSYRVAGEFLSTEDVIGRPNHSTVVYARNPDLRPSPHAGQMFNGGGRPIALNQPCPTILASAGGNKTHFLDTLNLVPQYHRHLMAGGLPREGILPGARRLTPEESALIQGFPTDMPFQGGRSSWYRQIGNAVPPPLGLALGREMLACLSRRTLIAAE